MIIGSVNNQKPRLGEPGRSGLTPRAAGRGSACRQRKLTLERRGSRLFGTHGRRLACARHRLRLWRAGEEGEGTVSTFKELTLQKGKTSSSLLKQNVLNHSRREFQETKGWQRRKRSREWSQTTGSSVFLGTVGIFMFALFCRNKRPELILGQSNLPSRAWRERVGLVGALESVAFVPGIVAWLRVQEWLKLSPHSADQAIRP